MTRAALSAIAFGATAACAEASPPAPTPLPGDRVVLHRVAPDYPAGVDGGPAVCQADLDILANGAADLICVRCEAERQPRLFAAAVERVVPLWRFSRAPGAAPDRVTIEFPFESVDASGRRRPMPVITHDYSTC